MTQINALKVDGWRSKSKLHVQDFIGLLAVDRNVFMEAGYAASEQPTSPGPPKT